MRKIILVLLFVFSLGTSLQAQDTFFNDSLRKYLKQYLVDKDIEAWPELYDSNNLIIRNLINMKSTNEDSKAGDYKYGIYRFMGRSMPGYGHIVIRCNDDYEILEMNDMWNNKPLTDIMTELIAYFSRHPDVPKALFPLYVDAVSRVYHDNSHWESEFGAYEYENRPNDLIYHYIVD